MGKNAYRVKQPQAPRWRFEKPDTRERIQEAETVLNHAWEGGFFGNLSAYSEASRIEALAWEMLWESFGDTDVKLRHQSEGRRGPEATWFEVRRK